MTAGRNRAALVSAALLRSIAFGLSEDAADFGDLLGLLKGGTEQDRAAINAELRELRKRVRRLRDTVMAFPPGKVKASRSPDDWGDE